MLGIGVSLSLRNSTILSRGGGSVVLFIPSGATGLITSDGDTFKVRDA